MLFQWTRLASNQFRLLERRTPLPSDEPSFVLKDLSLTSTSFSSYAAIVYPKPASESPTASVVLNGRSFSVAKLATEALAHVQRHDVEGYEYLWIDCLCVNLRDEGERRLQESIMERTYEGAKCIIAFLPENTRGVKTVSEISKQSSSKPSLPSPVQAELQSFAEAFAELGTLPSGHCLWSSSRVFTPADIVLYVGSGRFDQKDVDRVLSLVRKGDQKSSNGQAGPENFCL